MAATNAARKLLTDAPNGRALCPKTGKKAIHDSPTSMGFIGDRSVLKGH